MRTVVVGSSKLSSSSSLTTPKSVQIIENIVSSVTGGIFHNESNSITGKYASLVPNYSKNYIHTSPSVRSVVVDQTTTSSSSVTVDNNGDLASSSVSSMASVKLPTNEDVANFVSSMDTLTLGTRIQTLTTLQNAVAASTRDHQSSHSWTRQLAHTILTREIVGIEDIQNPARNWTRTYEDMLKEKSTESNPLLKNRSSSSSTVYGKTTTLSSPRSSSQNITYFEDSTVSNKNIVAEADAAFGADSALSPNIHEKVENGTTLTGITDTLSSSAMTSNSKERRGNSTTSTSGNNDNTDRSPPIGGALSFIPQGSLVPSSTTHAPSNTVVLSGTFYLQTVIDQLKISLAVLKDTSSLLASFKPLSSNQFDNGKSEAVIAAVLKGTSDTASLSSLSENHLQWLSTLTEIQILELQNRILLCRRLGFSTGMFTSGNIPNLTTILHTRTKKIEQIIKVLEDSRKASPLPSMRSLFTSLHTIVKDDSLNSFTRTVSTAAFVAGRIQENLRSIETELNKAASWTLRTTTTDKIVKDTKDVVGANTYSINIPSINQLVNEPSVEITSYSLNEKPNGTTFTFVINETKDTQGSPLTVTQAVNDRLNNGDVLTMLSPLMRILTPYEWSVIDTTVRATLPDWNATLASPVGTSTTKLHTNKPVLTSSVATASTLPTLGSTSVDTITVPVSTGSVTPTTDSNASSLIVNPTGTANTVLTSIAQRLNLGPSTVSTTNAIKEAYDNAPNELSRIHYMIYLLKMRASREELVRAAYFENEWLTTAANAKKMNLTEENLKNLKKSFLTVWNSDSSTNNVRPISNPPSTVVQSAATLEQLYQEEILGIPNAVALQSVKDAGLLAPGDAPSTIPYINADMIENSNILFRRGQIKTPLQLIEQTPWHPWSTLPYLPGYPHTPEVYQYTDNGTKTEALYQSLTKSIQITPAPLPQVAAWQLAWVSERAIQGFPKDTGKTMVSSPAAIASSTVSSNHSTIVSSPRNVVVRMTKAAINADAISRTGSLESAFANDIVQRTRTSRMNAVRKEVELKDTASKLGVTKADIDPRWWRYSYTETFNYRENSSYSVVHYRMLEAMDNKDLNAVWTLFSEYCILNPQEGSPDILAFEILLDACARAQRYDLVFGVVWPRIMQLRIVPTPIIHFLLIKCASLIGNVDLALVLLRNAIQDGITVDSRHFHAVISAMVEAKQLQKAYNLFNYMKRKSIGATAGIFGTLFEGAAKANRPMDCHYIYATLERSHHIIVPSALYTRMLEVFAQQGNIENINSILIRMKRRIDGNQKPQASALVAILQMYVEKRNLSGAESVVQIMEQENYFSSSIIPREVVLSLIQYLKDGTMPSNAVLNRSSNNSNKDTNMGTADSDDGAGIVLENGKIPLTDDIDVLDDDKVTTLQDTAMALQQSFTETAAMNEAKENAFFDRSLLQDYADVEAIFPTGNSHKNPRTGTPNAVKAKSVAANKAIPSNHANKKSNTTTTISRNSNGKSSSDTSSSSLSNPSGSSRKYSTFLQ